MPAWSISGSANTCGVGGETPVALKFRASQTWLQSETILWHMVDVMVGDVGETPVQSLRAPSGSAWDYSQFGLRAATRPLSPSKG